MPAPTVFAAAPDGLVLPVIDVTNPAFTPELTESDLPARTAAYVADETRRRRTPLWITGAILWFFGQRAPLLRAITSANRFLPGLSTYLLKLGPANLPPPYDSPIDKAVASSLPAASVRLRLLHMAQLLAEGLEAELSRQPEAPLHLVNIAGGPAMDSLNALILLRQRAPDLLEGRTIALHVIDVDASGPAFGARALTALLAPGAPLDGLRVTHAHIQSDWSHTEALSTLLAGLEGVVAASSEGGLFEYGSDEDVAKNLAVLHWARVPLVVGSVTRDDEATVLLNTSGTRFRTVMRGLDRFGVLANGSGYAIATSKSSVFSDEVLLRLA